MPDSPVSIPEKPSVSQLEGPRNPHDESSIGAPAFNVDEAAVLRKMDVRLIPMLSILYLLAFLDRGNIGNAKIEGLVDDLHMTGPQYNWTCMNLSLQCPCSCADIVSDCFLLHILRLRTAQQPPSQEIETLAMVTANHGRMGDCDGTISLF